MLSFFKNHILKYNTPINLNFNFNFGIFLILCLIIQIITGFLLSMYYIPNAEEAYNSVNLHIMKESKYGWFFRYAHANGASIFFICIYFHIGKAIFYKSYLPPKAHLWLTGVLLFILLMATAFLGYVLPWGQMSFWGATVITNLIAVIPKYGDVILNWIWGAYSPSSPTLHRMYSLHFILPFIMLIIMAQHILLLHNIGSSEVQSIEIDLQKMNLYPYYWLKDLIGVHFFFFFFSLLIYFDPNYFAHTVNYEPANSLKTPEHIVPEWYFLPFYAMLRSFSNKTVGVLIMLVSLIIYFFLPYFKQWNKKKIYFSFINTIKYQWIVFIFFFNFMFLGWLGANLATNPYILWGKISTFIYFFIILFFFQ